MNGMFMNHCLICSDIKHFEMKVHDAKRIADNVERILVKYGDIRDLKMCEEHGKRHSFDFDTQHQHFMCGHCYKANLQSLRNAEREIVDNLLRFVMLIKNENIESYVEDYHMILRNLQGYYPGMYRALEREWYQSRKDER